LNESTDRSIGGNRERLDFGVRTLTVESAEGEMSPEGLYNFRRILFEEEEGGDEGTAEAVGAANLS